jgi:hypothetical protein
MPDLEPAAPRATIRPAAPPAPVSPDAYDRLAIVALGTPQIVDAVEQVRKVLPPSGRPILPAHVTVRGTFVEPTDVDEIVRRN